MAEKNIKSRIVHKHDTAANWVLATGFTPKAGEIIIYDVDDTHLYERIKVGDGKKNVNNLPFVDDAVNAKISTLVGSTSVATQINTALNQATADDFGIFVQATEPTGAIDGDIWIDTANNPSYVVPTLPQVTEQDNGKVLMVVNGTLQLVKLNLSVNADGVLTI